MALRRHGKTSKCQVQQLMPVIPAAQEAEIGRITVSGKKLARPALNK
jgi:hypothetical protein